MPASPFGRALSNLKIEKRLGIKYTLPLLLLWLACWIGCAVKAPALTSGGCRFDPGSWQPVKTILGEYAYSLHIRLCMIVGTKQGSSLDKKASVNKFSNRSLGLSARADSSYWQHKWSVSKSCTTQKMCDIESAELCGTTKRHPKGSLTFSKRKKKSELVYTRALQIKLSVSLSVCADTAFKNWIWEARRIKLPCTHLVVIVWIYNNMHA